MTAAELVERVAVNAIPGSPHEDCLRIARAAVTEMLDAILEQPARGMQAGYSLRAMLDALAAEIREAQ